MKKTITLLLAFIMTAAVFISTNIFAAAHPGDTNGDGTVDNKDVVTLFRYVSGNGQGAVEENCDFNGDGEVNNKDVTSLFRAVSSGIIPEWTEEETTEEETTEEETEEEEPEEKVLEPGWLQTIVNANELANGVQGRYTDAERKKFLISNTTTSLLYDLTTRGGKQIEGIYNKNGKAYIRNTGDAYIIDSDGTLFSAAYSSSNARMNSNRLGYYYYDFRFRDQSFINPDADAEGDTFDIIKNSYSWAGNDVSNVTKRNGRISYTVTSPLDPYIYPGKVSFSAEKYNAVQMTIKTEYAASGYIYLIAGSYTGYNADQLVPFNCIAGQETTVYVSFANVPDYNGNVIGFRIDCGAKSGEKIEITEITAVNRDKNSAPLAFERVFHTYSDKMHEVVRIVATEDYKRRGRFETKTVIPASTVRSFAAKNINTETDTPDGFDFSTAEFVAFDIKGAGVYGIIMPNTTYNGDITVTFDGENYTIIRGIDILYDLNKGEDLFFGHRIYTSSSHSFDGIRKETYIERNPLSGSVTSYADGARYNYYDAFLGCYVFSVNALEFDDAYYRYPDRQFKTAGLLKGDGIYDRNVYIQTSENVWTKRGRLECAALLDENNTLLPIPLEVCKNFDGENEEPLYAYEPGNASAAFGEVYAPITVCKDESKQFTMLHLYQNWGNYPLKQLSSIAFHTPYYHLSVGVTETNCIVPYYVFGKDGWVLPDFRSNSAPFWTNYGERGTQHTSVGRLYFLQYKDAAGNSYKSESQSADIASHGPVYADITTKYLSDDGKINATYRHVEMAQTDENRTYYNIKLEVLDDIEIADFKNDFSFFTFDSLSVSFAKIGYLDTYGNRITENVKNTNRIIKLGKDYPYYDYYGGNKEDSVNFALIVKRSDITIGGKKYDGRFVLKDSFDGTLNAGSLSLDLGAVTLKKGDIIELDIILLPWGYSTSTDDSNVRNVRQDSCIDPYKLTVIEGEEYEDRFVPSVRAVNNTATFTLSGGASVAAVRVYGFTGYTKPNVTFKVGGQDTGTVLEGVNGNDGYSVFSDDDGTYSFSFNLDMDKADEYEITVTQ